MGRSPGAEFPLEFDPMLQEVLVGRQILELKLGYPLVLLFHGVIEVLELEPQYLPQSFVFPLLQWKIKSLFSSMDWVTVFGYTISSYSFME